MSVKRWCGRAAAGTETAAMNRMVEWHGDPDEDTPYVLASDYDALASELEEVKAELARRTSHVISHRGQALACSEAVCNAFSEAQKFSVPLSVDGKSVFIDGEGEVPLCRKDCCSYAERIAYLARRWRDQLAERVENFRVFSESGPPAWLVDELAEADAALQRNEIGVTDCSRCGNDITRCDNAPGCTGRFRKQPPATNNGLVDKLRQIEARHVEQNRIKGRDESRSTTLRLVREALAMVTPAQDTEPCPSKTWMHCDNPACVVRCRHERNEESGS